MSETISIAERAVVDAAVAFGVANKAVLAWYVDDRWKDKDVQILQNVKAAREKDLLKAVSAYLAAKGESDV